MKVLLYSNNKIDPNYDFTKQIALYLQNNNEEVVILKEMESFFTDINFITFEPEMSEKIKLLFVIGDDGTFLSAAHDFYKYNIPYLMLNNEKNEALEENNINNCYKIIDKVLDNRFKVESKPILSVKVVSDKGYEKILGFNEVLVHRGQYIKKLKIDMKIENHFKDSFLADGVLVSTNMGSSAYNLSAGGPLLLNNANCFVITSICTQSGIIPSIVYNADDQVEITAFAKDEKKYVVVVDGRDQIDAANGTKVFVKKSSEVLHIVTTETENKTINHITKSFNGYTKY